MSYYTTILADNPLAYWRLDTASSTEASKVNAGVPALTFGAATTRNVAGLLAGETDTACAFPSGAVGVTSGISTARTTQLEPSGTIAIECLIHQTAIDLTNPKRIIHYGDSGNGTGFNPNWYLSTDVSGGLKFGIATLSGGFQTVTYAVALQAGITYHLVARYDGAFIEIFINGVSLAALAKTGAIVYSQPASGLGIGIAYNEGPNIDAFNGTIDEVSIFTSLSNSQIVAHHNAAINTSQSHLLTEAGGRILQEDGTGGLILSPESIAATDTAVTETDSPVLIQSTGLTVTDVAATQTQPTFDLLTEAGGHLLQENGGQILFERPDATFVITHHLGGANVTDVAATISDTVLLRGVRLVQPGTDIALNESDLATMQANKVLIATQVAATMSDAATMQATHTTTATDIAATESDAATFLATRYITAADIAATVSEAAAIGGTKTIVGRDVAATITDTGLITINPGIPISNLTQIKTFHLQVFRNGNWVDIPVQSAQGNVQKNQSGQLTLVMPDNQTDSYRSRLYEGEKVRAYRGIVGLPPVRCWTGYVDVPTATEQIGVTRNPIATDNIQELHAAILLQGVIYDNLTPNAACVDVINKAIETQQLKLTDDSGVALSSTAGYNNPAGNQICYFPDSINFDGSLLSLASGTLGSFTSGSNPTMQFVVPTASFAAYSAFELSQQFIIASTFSMYGFTVASMTGSTLPPPVGTCIIDFYNGIFYFNPADASRTASISGFYYSTPLWAFTAGTTCADVISQIMDKVGARWSVDAFGKFYSRYIDTTVAPSRVYGKEQYTNLQIQTNRDRRNVIVCEGWDGNCGQIFTSKCINYEDINNAPPIGLGKRAYIIMQDPSWKTRTTINNAVYYAAQQIGRRGKIMSVKIIDDPSLILENVLCFSGNLADSTESDFFYIEGIQWSWVLNSGGKIEALATVTATALPGQGTFYLGPSSATTAQGFFDFSQDVLPMGFVSLTPVGGTYSSTFSIAAGLNLNYTAFENGFEAIDIYGSDGSHFGAYQATRTAGPLIVIMPTNLLTAHVWYVIKLRYEDALGNIGVFRSFIQALP